MDTRDTPEQAELRRTARRLARELGPRSVADLDDESGARGSPRPCATRAGSSCASDAGDGAPLASGVEAAIIADALGEAVADVPFTGPVLAADLARRAGRAVREGAVVAFSRDLVDAAVVSGRRRTRRSTPSTLPHRALSRRTCWLRKAPAIGSRRWRATWLRDGADLTRTIRAIPAGAPLLPVPGQSRLLGRADLDAWAALGLALTSADLVGLVRGVLDLTVAYAQQRKQYGVAIGSFQAVQHLLAEARCLLEGAFSAALYPAWAVDALGAEEARTAGRVAKAYGARAARTVCETAVQVHGGMGNTWDCLVHVHLRRALLSSRWFGDAGEQLRQLQRARLGEADGLS